MVTTQSTVNSYKFIAAFLAIFLKDFDLRFGPETVKHQYGLNESMKQPISNVPF